jgi:hypothetical protein
VALLVGFERYSAECVSANAADAELHRHLRDVAAVTRTMFEESLARVVVEEGLVPGVRTPEARSAPDARAP